VDIETNKILLRKKKEGGRIGKPFEEIKGNYSQSI
jgi:hypothetical protein